MDHTLYAVPSHEIPSIIEKAALFGGKIAQPSSTQNPSTNILRLDIDSSGFLLIKFPEDIVFERNRPVAIRLNYRNMTFSLSSQDYSIEGQTLIGQIPKEARALQIRDTDRYVFPFDTNVQAFIHRVEKRAGSLDTTIKLIDVSEKGLGILLSDVEEDTLIAHDHIWLHSINGIKLEQPIFGRVIYSIVRKFRDSSDLKCGISLEQPIPEEIFSELKAKCLLVLKA